MQPRRALTGARKSRRRAGLRFEDLSLRADRDTRATQCLLSEPKRPAERFKSVQHRRPNCPVGRERRVEPRLRRRFSACCNALTSAPPTPSLSTRAAIP